MTEVAYDLLFNIEVEGEDEEEEDELDEIKLNLKITL